ncbi:S1C family serine protease [Pseudalkalibacillus sp. Hm43]|uniref:S1C family serine protease n=1 Tax=Pseudalkalibacillus sp. Hm43 TaxID=3450742 RepID=UPI003F42DE79
MNTRTWISTITTSLILITGIVGGYLLYNHFNHFQVNATSTIGSLKEAKEKSDVHLEKDLKTIIHESQKSVVQLDVESDSGNSVGSGFLYNDQGDVVTNAHVVAGAKKITIRTADAQQYEGQLIGIGKSTDIALVRVPKLEGNDPLPVLHDHLAEIGDEVIALGSPLGLQNSVTTGIISGLNRDFTLENYTYSNVYQISAPITQGNSGGPLIDQRTGEVVAINSAGTEEGSIGFSIPMKDVFEQLSSWSENPSNVTPPPQNEDDNSITKELDAEDSKYIVGYFYESLAMGDYVTAYSLLGSEWQKNTSYEKFRNGYIHTVDITINQIKAEHMEEEEAMKVTIIIDALERQKNRETKTFVYKCTYTVSFENNLLKILNGKATKVE